MPSQSSTSALSATLRDMYPAPGSRVKQWVVESWRESAWERETCPRVAVPDHNDNTGTGCRNLGEIPWAFLAHDCCATCDELHEQASTRPDVVAWLAAKAARPPITSDREALSDQIAPNLGMLDNPMLRLAR